MFFKENNKYQRYMESVRWCEDFLLACIVLGDENLATFYRNAAEGYRIKARNLKLQDA